MKKKYYFIFLTIVFNCVLCISGIAQKTKVGITQAEQVKTEIQELKTSIKALEAAAVIDLGKEDNKIADLTNQLGGLDNKIGALKNDQDLYLKVLGFLGIPATLVGLILLFFSVKKLIEDKVTTNLKNAEALVDSKIANIVADNKSNILQLIRSQDLENMLKNESSMLLVSPNQKEENIIKGIMNKFKFSGIKYRVMDNYQNPKQEFDLVIFNQMENDIVKEFLKNANEDDFFVAFTKVNLDRHERLNFANSPMTLYSNILNTLKYKHLLNA